ncbi:hypothetical protein [Vitiosangium sp. GDMCC 1.1324]|uniref:hypothetical protein n=1 Tax=Vitiosangium sp. (strain GDMCC 1.1324) TaxID=2138576 RepID=UPI000D352982|nr:hypothetical protein [Vitiosangium sp. GDMCC 1.1324]PTL75622.1 hypothetical protein DAT35_53300 [Vitiosangium sp. GDMCC 1.1324]
MNWVQLWQLVTAHIGAEEIGKWIADNLVAMVGGLAALFWLRKVRAEEALKVRLQLVLEVNDSFSELELAVQRWANPIVHGDTDKYAQFLSELGALTPAAFKALHRASLLLEPAVVKQLGDMLDGIGGIQVEYQNHLMFRESNKAAPGAFVSEMKRTFEAARKELPRKISEANEALRHSLRQFLFGSRHARRWQHEATRLGLLPSVHSGEGKPVLPERGTEKNVA